MNRRRRIWLVGGALLLLLVGAFALGQGLWMRSVFPTRSSLVAATKTADRIVVVTSAFEPRSEDRNKQVFELRGREQVESLLAEMEWIPPRWGAMGLECSRTISDGRYRFDLYEGDQLQASIGWLGNSIRWRDGPWPTDVNLTDHSRLALSRWFAERGFPALQESAAP